MATRNQQEDQPKPKTYRALRRTWISHEARMVEAGEVFTTAFPRVPKRAEQGVVTTDADGRLVVRPEDRSPRKANGKPEMVDMDLGDNLELADGEEEASEPAIGLERGDKRIDRERIDAAMQDHVDRQRASLPSPGLPRQEGAEPQRAMDGPPTRDTDDDKDAAETPAQKVARERAARNDPERTGMPGRDRTRG